MNPEDLRKFHKLKEDGILSEEEGGLNDQVQHVTHQVRCCYDSLLSPPLC